MSQRIPEEVIEEIKSRSDIVEIISEYVVLKRSGNNYLGLCPFHSEKTPSFSVSQDKQMYYCFGCGAGGNVFTFLMEYRKLTFLQAVEELASRSGVALPVREMTSIEKKRLRERKSIVEALTIAAEFYHSVLKKYPAGRWGLDYLTSRGVDSQTIDEFQLGYAPARWDALSEFLKRRGFSEEILVRGGLAGQGKKSAGIYDRFRNRVMFPIRDASGQVVGFGGRVIDGSEPKYLNSPETQVFHKSQNLYGLPLAADSIRRQKKAILMEGYLDVITAHQFGVKIAVASLGTSFTKEQAQLLKRYTDTVVVGYDADAAGQAAAARGMELLAGAGFTVKVIKLPPGLDPDEVLRSQGRERFDELLDGALPLMEYRIRRQLEQMPDRQVATRARVVENVLPSLIALNNEIERSEYIHLLAQELQLDEQAIWQEVQRRGAPLQKTGINADKKVKIRYNSRMDGLFHQKAVEEAELNIFRRMLVDREFTRQIAASLEPDLFSEPGFKVLQAIQGAWKNSDQPRLELSRVMGSFTQGEAAIIARLEMLDQAVSPQAVEDSLKVLRQNLIRKKLRDLEEQLKAAEKAGNQEMVGELLTQISDLYHKLN